MGRITQKTPLNSEMNFQTIIVLLAIIPSSFGAKGDKRCQVKDKDQCKTGTENACHFLVTGTNKDDAKIVVTCETFGTDKKCSSPTVSNNVVAKECCVAPVDSANDASAPLQANGKEFNGGACALAKGEYDKLTEIDPPPEANKKCSQNISCSAPEMDACYYKVDKGKLIIECEKAGVESGKKCATKIKATNEDETQCCAPADTQGGNMINSKEFRDDINEACKAVEKLLGKSSKPNPTSSTSTNSNSNTNSKTNGSNINDWSLWVLLTIYIILNP